MATSSEAATARPPTGPHNDVTDVEGVCVGHHTMTEAGALTGVTVVAPPPGTTGGVDVRGAAPGTRETDLLDPVNVVDRVDAVVLAGGSAYGLAAADGVMAALEDEGRGWPVGEGVVPIVPAAVIFDLGRGGDVRARPGAEAGRAAYAARSDECVPLGSVGAGTGAVAGGLRGGVGSASAVLPSGATVAALVVVNSAGSVVDPATGCLYALRQARPADHLHEVTVSAERLAAYQGMQRERRTALEVGAATTLGVVVTDYALTKAQCTRLATIGHDGMARAVDPVHTVFDGDTVFALATGSRPAPTRAESFDLLEAAAGCVARAIARAVSAATPGGPAPTYHEMLGE
ncbi:MAG: P1 family peptidase [Dermatophilaceae bacterium]|nr:P1 family peptidase [Intrasporangiaceae bacterium]